MQQQVSNQAATNRKEWDWEKKTCRLLITDFEMIVQQMRKGYKDNNKKKSVSEPKVSVSAAFLLLLHFLYPNVETVYLSYFVVITLMNYSPFFICDGLKCCHLTIHPPPYLDECQKVSRFFHFLKNGVSIMYKTTLQWYSYKMFYFWRTNTKFSFQALLQISLFDIFSTSIKIIAKCSTMTMTMPTGTTPIGESNEVQKCTWVLQETLTDLPSLLSIFKIEAPWDFQPLCPHLVPHKLLLLNDILNNENTQIFSASLYFYLCVYCPTTRVTDIMKHLGIFGLYAPSGAS